MIGLFQRYCFYIVICYYSYSFIVIVVCSCSFSLLPLIKNLIYNERVFKYNLIYPSRFEKKNRISLKLVEDEDLHFLFLDYSESRSGMSRIPVLSIVLMGTSAPEQRSRSSADNYEKKKQIKFQKLISLNSPQCVELPVSVSFCNCRSVKCGRKICN
jgi:hypothetical protein